MHKTLVPPAISYERDMRKFYHKAHPYSEAFRFHALSLLDDGLSMKDVSGLLRVTVATLYNWRGQEAQAAMTVATPTMEILPPMSLGAPEDMDEGLFYRLQAENWERRYYALLSRIRAVSA